MILKIKTLLFFCSALILFSSCNKNTFKDPKNLPSTVKLEQFDKTVKNITKDLSIDSYAYALVTNAGVLSIYENGISLDQQIPTGELSNLVLCAMLLQASENDLVDTRDYLSEFNIEHDMGKIQLKNLLSFTTEVTDKPISYDPNNFVIVKKILEEINEKDISRLFKSQIAQNLKLQHSNMSSDHGDIIFTSSLSDLIILSQSIDNQLLFEDEYTHNQMIRPVYLESGERSPAGLGCFIDINKDRKYIWTAGKSNDYSSLMLKSAADSVSLILIAAGDALAKTIDMEGGDINPSPVAHAFRDLIISDSAFIALDFYADIPSLEAKLQLKIDSNERDAAFDELLAYIRMYKTTGNTQRLSELSALFARVFPHDIPLEYQLKQPVAAIDRVIDYMQISRNFSLSEPAVIKLFTTGEFTKEMSMNPWEYDNVEIFFDLNHERSSGFNSGGDDRHIRVNYDHPDITGNAPRLDEIRSVQYDVSATQYNFEVVIPWTALLNQDTIPAQLPEKVGFDIAIADNDSEVREGSKSWQSELNAQPWANTSTYGTMIIAGSAGPVNDTICYSVRRKVSIDIDGVNKGEWNGVPRYAIDTEYMEGITSPEDQSGWFRSQWDEENLYILVEVQDDVKRLLDKSGDFGWITSTNGDTLWIMQEELTSHAGGAITNRYQEVTLPLDAGKYTLHYNTNQTHSYGRWVYERPEMTFYGIRLY